MIHQDRGWNILFEHSFTFWDPKLNISGLFLFGGLLGWLIVKLSNEPGIQIAELRKKKRFLHRKMDFICAWNKSCGQENHL
jgi:hypothetical protein